MPPVSGPLKTNPLVDLLRTYGPVPAAHSIWDEHVLKATQRTGVRPIEVPSDRLDGLVANFRSANPVSVILTGTAGDGKTWHCRKVFEALGGSAAEWAASGPLLLMPLGERRLVIVKDLSQFYGQQELPDLLGRILPALLGSGDNEVFLVAANDGQLLRFWGRFAQKVVEAQRIDERIRVMLKEDKQDDPDLRVRLHNLSRQPHDQMFERAVDALHHHEGWAACGGCAIAANGACAIRRNLAALASSTDPGMRTRLRSLIRLAAFNDSHLPIRHVLLLAVNIILGVSDRSSALMRCSTAHGLAEEGELAASNPYDNALGLNVPEATRGQYRAFTVFEDMGIGRETNSLVDAMLVDALPKDDFDRLVRSDPVFGNGLFEQARRAYQKGESNDFAVFRTRLEQQRRRLFFTMPRQPKSGSPLDPWRLTIFNYGGEYLEFAASLMEGRSVDLIRSRLVTGLNRSYTGAMCDEIQEVWFASPAANTQSRLGRVLDVQVKVGRSRRYTYWFEFSSEEAVAHGRPRMVLFLNDGSALADVPVTPLLFEYLLRVQAGSLPGSFSRQCFEELRQFRLRVVAALTRHGIINVDEIGDLRVVRTGTDGKLQSEGIDLAVSN